MVSSTPRHLSNRTPAPRRPRPLAPDQPRTRRILDPDRFLVSGAVVDWEIVQQTLGLPQPAQGIANRRQISTRLVQLRWLMDPEQLGYPTEPFKVWRRPIFSLTGEQTLEWELSQTSFGFNVITWEEPQTFVRPQFQASGNGVVFAYAGAPIVSPLVGATSLSLGSHSLSFSGAAIQSLLISPGLTLQQLTGVDADIINSPGWELVEQVGLPTAWRGVFNLDQPQGLVDALGSPMAAALDRYRRGAPFYGWSPLMAPGIPAPPWRLADPQAMIQALRDNVFDDLRRMITTLPPRRHHRFELTNDLELSGSGHPGTLQFSPLKTLLFGAATDPLLSLISGFGTAFDDVNADAPSPTLERSHYMVTARYEQGLDGRSDPVEYAAMLLHPDLAPMPPAPTNVTAKTDGHQAPDQVDRAWQGVVRLYWDKVADMSPFRVGSYAAARVYQAPPTGVVPLMSPRLGDTALQPISATTSEAKDEANEPLQALDDSCVIASTPVPNSLRYGLAHQDLFGVWSPWATVGHTLEEPAPQGVSILSARLEVTPPASGSVCPATLVVDLAWDWQVRSPRRIELVGRLYGQAKRDDPPANTNRPAGLQTALNGPVGAPFRITFNGEANGQPDANGTLAYLSEDGKSFLPAPLEIDGPRRYRLTIAGLSLDYATVGHIGLALWAGGQENRAPQRLNPWPENPMIVSASDPRAPVITGTHENVLLASVADASGEHHAKLTWPSYSGAVGYFIYTTTETQLRVDRGLPDPGLHQTLSERLAELRNAFEADPNRQSFTRLNDQAIAQREIAVTLPRGSKEIHLYLVLGVGAGQIESAWPDASDPDLRLRPIAYAAPQIVPPAPPLLEVNRYLDDSADPPVYRARVQINTRPGATITQIDLHRVRVPAAALTLDTMGPAVAALTGSEAGWEVTENTSTAPGEAQPLGTLTGSDTPTGSWRPVFYRAVAWSEDIPSRGIYGSRSLPSAAREVVIPPMDPPPLSVLTYQLSGQNRTVLIRFNSSAPVATTPLGPHRIRAAVYAQPPNGRFTAVYHYPEVTPNGTVDDSLEALTTLSGLPLRNRLWRRNSTTPGLTQYSLRIRRATAATALKVNVQLIDPLGRVTERTLTVPPVLVGSS
ncbi:MAG: hypothetical protein F6J95_002695 [Leptolyngbya sp. SIO1E4]|nr:hypothetical protein [Leptolyngbya sp. SIO1E4]